MAVDSTPIPTLPWKNMVMGKGSTVSYWERDLNATNTTFSLLEGDVKKLILNDIPAIVFSDRKNGSKFQYSEDYEKVLSRGPWIIFGQYLTVQPWTLYPSNVLAWIRLLGLPSHLLSRGQYVRMIVFINLEKPLISQVLINGNLQLIEYKSLSIVFFSCGRYGHSKDGCPHIQATGNKSEEYTLTIGNPQPDADLTTRSDDFGPWMLVERRFREWFRDKGQIFGHGKNGKEIVNADFGKILSRSNAHDKGPSKTGGLSIGQSSRSSNAPGPNAPLKDHLIGGAVLPNAGKTDTTVDNSAGILD
ncbi:hypothetical protein PVK06_020531 [Gossypium arboreum]|uniref:DUF4283 domain-containing protein n=1 Tax=Gossypium arboreum TaxID=29729 RepID=A0ABR0PMT3_GOSAR|nr:hypothetical protein PVK06_020531 [Gossypium arboreum]